MRVTWFAAIGGIFEIPRPRSILKNKSDHRQTRIHLTYVLHPKFGEIHRGTISAYWTLAKKIRMYCFGNGNLDVKGCRILSPDILRKKWSIGMELKTSINQIIAFGDVFGIACATRTRFEFGHDIRARPHSPHLLHLKFEQNHSGPISAYWRIHERIGMYRLGDRKFDAPRYRIISRIVFRRKITMWRLSQVGFRRFFEQILIQVSLEICVCWKCFKPTHGLI
jgi:hypothetical protein